jgi:hypothetical protein
VLSRPSFRGPASQGREHRIKVWVMRIMNLLDNNGEIVLRHAANYAHPSQPETLLAANGGQIGLAQAALDV